MIFFKILALALMATTFALPAAADEKLNVVASFSILGDFAKTIGGEHIQLQTIVGPDSDAHVYEPKPSDAIATAKADIVLVNGLMFEGFLARLIDASRTSAIVVEASKGAALIEDNDEHHHHHHDHDEDAPHMTAFNPHAWHSVGNAKIYVKNITDAFCKADEKNCPSYQENATAYLAKLDALDLDIRKTIALIPDNRRVFVVAHNSFFYFERNYGVTFLSPSGVSTESEASAADMANVVREITDKQAIAIFAENISNSRLVEQIAAETGLKLGGTLYSDALSKPDGKAATYLDMMRSNLALISKAAHAL
ncbi:metal ABC transporter solute-binding protein, Zn/Mn family [Aquamicrobium segne]|uniref:Metal ABC transporter solute-binding protein, Zn/Mn family n=1 Tax=Aquamicrobium segne TaxID=469547 RepID=A0ABW0GTV2_9HYPH